MGSRPPASRFDRREFWRGRHHSRAMGKAKGKKGRRGGDDSDDDEPYVDPIKAALAAAAAGDGNDDDEPIAANKGNKKGKAAKDGGTGLGIPTVGHWRPLLADPGLRR